MHHMYLYGLDIETDTASGGVDPAVASVRTIALSSIAGDELFVGDEATMLRALDARLAELAGGVLATWNGATFDLPFLADRARLLDVELGLRLRLDRQLTLHRAPLPGHAGAYRGSWHGHGHLDTFRLYGRSDLQRPSRRAVGRVLKPAGTSTRPATGADLLNEAMHAHAPTDARLARVLAERRWPAALRLVDRVEADEAEQVAVAAQRVARQERIRAQRLRPATSATASA